MVGSTPIKPSRARAWRRYLRWGRRHFHSNRRAAFGGDFGANPVTFDRTLFVTNLGQLEAQVQSLTALGGGSLYVKGPGQYLATSPFVLARAGPVSNVEIVFGLGVEIVIPLGTDIGGAFAIPSAVGGSAIWRNLFELANCTNVIIRGGEFLDQTTGAPHNSTTCFHVGGNATNIKFIDCETNGFGRWAYWTTCYYAKSDGTNVQDGNCTNIQVIRPVGDSLGNISVPDGGGVKWGNQSITGGTIKRMLLQGAQFTNVFFAGMDTNFSSPGNYGSTPVAPTYFSGQDTNEDMTCEDNRFVMSSDTTKAKIGVFIENHQNGSQLPGLKKVRVRDNLVDMNGGGNSANAGISVGNANWDVLVTGNRVKNGASNVVAFAIVGGGGAPSGSPAEGGSGVDIGKAIRLISNSVEGCNVGLHVNVTGGLPGTVVQDLLVDGLTLDDNGSGNLTTGLKISVGQTTKHLWDATFRKVDCTKLANGAAPLSLTLTNDPLAQFRFEDCPGLSPFGNMANPVVDSGQNVIGLVTDSGAAAPNSGLVYKVASRQGVTVSATGATLTGLTGNDGRGFPLLALNELVNGGSTATPAASTTYTVIGEDMVVTSTGGTGVAITVTDFAGNVLANAVATISALVIPQGSTITFGAFSVAPTVTATGSIHGAIANMFLSNAATVPTRFLPYGSQLTPAGTVGTWTVQMPNSPTAAFATVASPFGTYRLMGIVSGGGTTMTASKTYKAQGGPLLLDVTTGGATAQFSVLDEYGNTIASPTVAATTRYSVAIPQGCFFRTAATVVTVNAIAAAS